jgi:hypothetical protein
MKERNHCPLKKVVIYNRMVRLAALETINAQKRQQEALKREQEAYILAEGGTEDGLKSILNRHA